MLWVPMLFSLSAVNISPQLEAAAILVWDCKSPIHGCYRCRIGFHFSIHVFFASTVMSPVVTALHAYDGKGYAVVVYPEATEPLVKIGPVFFSYGFEVVGFYDFLGGCKCRAASERRAESHKNKWLACFVHVESAVSGVIRLTWKFSSKDFSFP